MNAPLPHTTLPRLRRDNPFRPRTPIGAPEWRCAVEIANLLIALDLGRIWGLIDVDGRINVGRCESFLARGKTLGYTPTTIGPASVPPA
jgi:hypothetical protein